MHCVNLVQIRSFFWSVLRHFSRSVEVTDPLTDYTIHPNDIFLYLGFLSRTFTIHRAAREGGGYFFRPLYHFHPLHRHLDISQMITAESSPLQKASSQTPTGTFGFRAQVERKLLTTKLHALTTSLPCDHVTLSLTLSLSISRSLTFSSYMKYVSDFPRNFQRFYFNVVCFLLITSVEELMIF